MATTELSKRSDQLGRYYTAPLVGELLVRTMALRSPSTVLDLGAGDGALVRAASSAWPRASFLTVDIDRKAQCSALPRLRGRAFRHVTGDALSPNIAAKLGLHPGEASAALCNPPYIKPKWQQHFGELLEEAGLSGVMPRIGDVPADLLFIAQNLRFLRKGGRLGLILPDGIIAGEKYELFREHLLERHRVHSVIELPRLIFRGTEAKAHIVVVSKGPIPTDTLVVKRLDSNGMLSPALQVCRDVAAKRLDFSFLASKAGIHKSGKLAGRQLGSLVEVIGRGSYSSAEKGASRNPILHTSDLRAGKGIPRSFALRKEQIKQMAGPFAIPGDILVARVGRNHAEKIAMVRRGTYAVSDCLLVLRPDPNKAASIFSFLCSQQGKAALEAAAHGVGARFITSGALKNIIVPVR